MQQLNHEVGVVFYSNPLAQYLADCGEQGSADYLEFIDDIVGFMKHFGYKRVMMDIHSQLVDEDADDPTSEDFKSTSAL